MRFLDDIKGSISKKHLTEAIKQAQVDNGIKLTPAQTNVLV
jgi:hypothetical protein